MKKSNRSRGPVAAAVFTALLFFTPYTSSSVDAAPRGPSIRARIARVFTGKRATPPKPSAFRKRLGALAIAGTIALTSATSAVGAPKVNAPAAPERATITNVVATSASVRATVKDARTSALYKQVRDQLLALVKKEVYKQRDLEVFDVSLGEHTGVGVKIHAKPIAADDKLVTSDARRQAVTERMSKKGHVTWLLAGGGLYPRAGLTVPFGNGSVGFSANGMLAYSVLAPYALSADALANAGRNLTLDLPVTASKARALPEGTEVKLEGKASIVVRGSANVGESIAVGELATVGVRAGVDVSSPAEANIVVRIRRLSGERVHVSIAEKTGRSHAVAFVASAGVDSHIGQGLPTIGEVTLPDVVRTQVTRKLDRFVEKYMKADIRATHDSGASTRNVSAFTLDLSQPEGRRAYDHLIRLDQSKAEAANASEGAVVGGTLGERKRWTTDALNARVGPWTLLSAVSSAQERHGRVHTANGTVSYDRADLGDGFSFFATNPWLGKREIKRQLVSVKLADQTEAQAFLRVRYTTKKDKHTSKKDVRRFLELAEFLGADTTKAGKARKLGKTDRTVDVYVTDAGLQKLVGMSSNTLHTAFAAAYERFDRPWDMNYLIGGNRGVWRTTPWLAKDHPRHRDIIAMLESASSPSARRRGGNTRDSQEYRLLTGRSLPHDAGAYREAKSLVGLVEGLRTASSPAERVRRYAQFNRELGLDFWRELAMIGSAIGPKHVLINELSIKGASADRTIVLPREGAIADPQARIDRMLEPTP